jgi:hypothetical protein
MHHAGEILAAGRFDRVPLVAFDQERFDLYTCRLGDA